MSDDEENEHYTYSLINFNIKRVIGDGAFGRTFYARDKVTNKKYAIKKYKKIDDISFFRENAILDSLNEANNKYIVKKYCKWSQFDEVIINNEKGMKMCHYLALEFIPKGILNDYLCGANFSEEYVRVIFYKILKGVQTIHDKRITHLDLKLSNILMDKDYNPVICDFGVSIIHPNSPKIIELSGTRGYMAPEIILKKIPYNGTKADIFSLGVILFKLVTFKPVFYDPKLGIDDSQYKLIIGKKYQEFWDLLNVNKLNLSEEFKELVIKMISFEPSERPDNIRQILDSPWMNKYNVLSRELKYKLEEQVRKNLAEKEKFFNENYENRHIITTSDKFYDDDNKGDEEEEIIFIDDELKINELCLDDDLKMKNYINIEGKINPRIFMNKLAKKLKNLFDDKNEYYLIIEPNEIYFKFELIFKSDENDEISIELENKLKQNGVKNAQEFLNKNNKGELVIEIELLKQDNKYLISIFKNSGESEEFQEKFEKIISKITVQ